MMEVLITVVDRLLWELMATKFFTKLDGYNTNDNDWAKNNILSKFVTANTPAVVYL